MKQYLPLTPERGHAIEDGWLPPPSPPTTTSPRYSKKRLLAVVAAVSTAVILVVVPAVIGHSKKNSAQLGRVGNFKAAPVDAANEQQHSADVVNIYPEIHVDSIDAEQQHSDSINIYPEVNSADAAANRQQNFKAAPVDAANEQQHSDIVNIQYPEVDSIDAAANRQQHSDTVIIWPEQREDEIKIKDETNLNSLDLGEMFLRTVILFTQEGYIVRMLKVPV